MFRTLAGRWVAAAALVAGAATGSHAQTTATTEQRQAAEAAQAMTPDPHGQMQMDMEQPGGWRFMHDGVLFALFDHQGGPRGGDQFVVPNWWMGMASRRIGASDLTFNAMLSLDPATVGKSGYREIFQAGEALDGRPLIDRQHPHDLFMQLAAVWRTAVTDATGVTIAGGPAGEPALGPVAFMHRPSAADNPFAPLSHHTFDSAHIAYGVITAAIDHGPWLLEGSVFNGREPDQNRWDFDFGRLDSLSARLWYRPDSRWEIQVSTGHLVDPEEIEPGDIQRTTATAAWFKREGSDFTALTAGYGMNAGHGTNRHALFVEGTRHEGSNSMFGRVEAVQVETSLLLNDSVPPPSGGAALTDTVGAFTIGAVRDLPRWHGFEGGFGAAVTLYAVPDALETTHGAHPVSFQLFFRLRPPAGSMGRMWNMRMSQPMAGHGPSMSHQVN